ncbi:MAPEG family protein [Paracoccus aurantiacus]|uniref:MAPEG family protein n=1 Tax=Paracoccus aurantiacus TaxID=2599412 RepID=A0A5C6S2J5_9RHOB|nr:MAPEG family protein [Paracoccus aurantiacus]TXB68675.1 MAPEG family protein [Paracoccus aurantiacus]
MTPELTALTLAGLLQGVQFALYAVQGNIEHGPKVTMGTRDTLPPVGVRTGRLQRALNNHFEGLILFTLAVMVVTVGGESTAFTAACAWVYLLMRLLYVPAYVFGWVPWRSCIWIIGFAATMSMMLATLF